MKGDGMRRAFFIVPDLEQTRGIGGEADAFKGNHHDASRNAIKVTYRKVASAITRVPADSTQQFVDGLHGVARLAISSS